MRLILIENFSSKHFVSWKDPFVYKPLWNIFPINFLENFWIILYWVLIALLCFKWIEFNSFQVHSLFILKIYLHRKSILLSFQMMRYHNASSIVSKLTSLKTIQGKGSKKMLFICVSVPVWMTIPTKSWEEKVVESSFLCQRVCISWMKNFRFWAF